MEKCYFSRELENTRNCGRESVTSYRNYWLEVLFPFNLKWLENYVRRSQVLSSFPVVQVDNNSLFFEN